MLYYFWFICALYLGIFKLPYSGIFNDIAFLPIVIYTFSNLSRLFYTIKKQRVLKYLFIIWIVFIIYYSVLLISSDPYYSKVSKLLNIRAIYPFFFIFATIVIINTKSRLFKTIKFLIILVSGASLISITQSIYGVTPLFDPKGFYHTGPMLGTGELMIGPLARVMLANVYFIMTSFISLVIYNFYKRKISYSYLFPLLLFPIFLSFSRSNWIAIVFAIIAALVIISYFSVLSTKSIVKNIFGVGLIIIVISIILSTNSEFNKAINERFSLIFTDFNNNEGTYAVRQDNSFHYLLKWYNNGYYFGIDPIYMERNEEPELSDVGYVHILVSIGLVGLILYVSTWIINIIYSIQLIIRGNKRKTRSLSFIGINLFSITIYFIVSQQYMQQSYSTSLYVLFIGLTIATSKLILR